MERAPDNDDDEMIMRKIMSYFELKDGEKLYYEDIGQGRNPVIMLHGWTDNHTTFLEPVEILKYKARCIIYDYRGHGGSKGANTENITIDTLADDLHELMIGLNVKNVTLIGWSMGASVAFSYIKKYHCDKLKQVVLCDMTPKLLNGNGWHLGLYQAKYTAQSVPKDDEKAFLSLYTALAVGIIPKLKGILHFRLKHDVKNSFGGCDETALKSLYHSMMSQDNRAVVEKITVPFTYFYADPGSLFSPELALWYRVYVHCPFKAVKFSDSSHMLITEQPKKFAEEIEKLLSD